jgi:hypothetical protein
MDKDDGGSHSDNSGDDCFKYLWVQNELSVWQVGTFIILQALAIFTESLHLKTQSRLRNGRSGKINTLKTEFLLHYIQKCNLYLMENTSYLHYRDQSVNAVWGTNRFLLWEP